jgi:hypothetical protein
MLQKEHNIILYIRAKKYIHLRWKDARTTDFVYISDAEFLELPGFSQSALEDFILRYIIKTKKFAKDGLQLIRYSVDFNGEIDLSLIRNNRLSDFPFGSILKEHLMNVRLDESAPRSEYFEIFLKQKESFIDMYLIMDAFSGRIHSPVSIMKSDHRKNLLLYREPTISIDVVTMQPLILAKILDENIGENEYSNMIFSGNDIYQYFKLALNLSSRDEAKKFFFRLIFGKPDNKLYTYFGHQKWINWINQYKSKLIAENYRSKNKPHSNLAWLLQKNEVEIMREVWQSLSDNNIPFLPVHDEIIVKEKDNKLARKLFDRVLSTHFKYFQLK